MGSAFEERQRLEKLRLSLDAVRQRYLPTWQEQAQYLAPYRLQYVQSDHNRGQRLDHKIIDSTASLAIRTCKAGMMSGITTPARPWFGVIAEDPDLGAWEPVKDYLWQCTQRLRAIFSGSNLYTKLPTLYEDLIVFGTGNLGEVEDDEEMVRFTTAPPGTYWIATDERERVDTVVRQIQMTGRQIYRRFKDRTPGEIADMVRNGNGESVREVYQAVTRSETYDPNLPGARGMPFRSCWWSACGNELLGESGFESMPIFVPRWDVDGTDVWGHGPGLDAIGDVISLQAYERKNHRAVDKMLDPALMGPESLSQRRASLVPGDITWLDQQSLNFGGLKPIHQVQFDIAAAENKQEQIRQRINRAFYADLFLMLVQMERSGVTATEIEERKQEKLLGLGPLLQRLNNELLGPLIRRTFLIANRRGLLPPPPEELRGKTLQIEYLSIAAQAQKLAGLQATQAFMTFTAQAAQIQREALDKIDIDVALDDAAEQLGVNPKVVRDTQAAQAIRAQRAQAQAQAQAVQQQQEQAKLAQVLANTPMSDGSALAQLGR